MSDAYVKVTVGLVSRSANAILVDCEPNSKRERLSWIPLSLIHAADERRIDKAQTTELIEFRLRSWKAAQLKL